MHWLANVKERDQYTVSFSLRDLRTAKGITQRQMAHILDISKSLYHAIETGKRKPTIDTLFKLAAVYQTSMDFVFHAYYRQHFIWHYPDSELDYAMKRAKQIDIEYLIDRIGPEAPPRMPVAIIMERMDDEPEEAFKPYGLELNYD